MDGDIGKEFGVAPRNSIGGWAPRANGEFLALTNPPMAANSRLSAPDVNQTVAGAKVALAGNWGRPHSSRVRQHPPSDVADRHRTG